MSPSVTRHTVLVLVDLVELFIARIVPIRLKLAGSIQAIRWRDAALFQSRMGRFFEVPPKLAENDEPRGLGPPQRIPYSKG